MNYKIQQQEGIKLHFINTGKDFKKENFFKIYNIITIQQFWQVYNNLEFSQLFGHGSLHLSRTSPEWIPEHYTTSYIIPNKNPEQVWQDLSLFFVENVMNDNNNIVGVSMAVKGYMKNVLNLKVNTKSDTPLKKVLDYFGEGRVMKNSARVEKCIEKHKKPPLYFNTTTTKKHRKNKYYKK